MDNNFGHYVIPILSVLLLHGCDALLLFYSVKILKIKNAYIGVSKHLIGSACAYVCMCVFAVTDRYQEKGERSNLSLDEKLILGQCCFSVKFWCITLLVRMMYDHATCVCK